MSGVLRQRVLYGLWSALFVASLGAVIVMNEKIIAGIGRRNIFTRIPAALSISTRTFVTLCALLQLIQVRLGQFNGASHAGCGVAIWQTRAGPTSIGDREVNARCLRTSRNIVNNNSA